MRSQYRVWTRVTLFATATLMVAGIASAQKTRMRTYSKSLETHIEQELEAFRLASLREDPPDVATAPTIDWPARRRDSSTVVASQSSGQSSGDSSDETLGKPFKSFVIVGDSPDIAGQDAEIRLTMPINDFMEFAPIAALEAAAIPHKFSVGYIYLREETTDRVGRVAFADAEPIAARYLAGDEDAVEDMKDALIWH